MAAVLALIGCGGSGNEEREDGLLDHDEIPFTFEYPAGFVEDHDPRLAANFGSPAAASAAVLATENDGLVAQVRDLNLEVTEANLDLAQEELDSLIGPLSNRAGPRRMEVAGLPAFDYADLETPGIPRAKTRMIIIFNGARQYTLNCQSTPGKHRQVRRACELALRTFAPN